MPMNTTVLYPVDTVKVFTQTSLQTCNRSAIAKAPYDRLSSPASSVNTLISATIPKVKGTKDYSAAFGALQTSYGFAGHAPTPQPERQTSPKPRASKRNFFFILGRRSPNTPDVANCTEQPVGEKRPSQSQKGYAAAYTPTSYGLPAGSAAVPQEHWRSGVA
ncbi:hypothetical protein PUNSTDRAFT_123938 [Punctularia strigosozonata HHB-11173 SS5]|uniref:uncharacterized protein n=1 Tax=Punctularia strigosozonata (strain HHB-11173) TaxID=741275 RepID=UPI00044177F1|nr:uncharacterized protein PUNSTDRAFT_123938 [Punctularia strigosozonata HHB-11173 SS5]EIN14364.1 hypothetical protein PUNSTDRAFT_123938 [Punctularia strigosozonata HHB-11173 SS5]